MEGGNVLCILFSLLACVLSQQILGNADFEGRAGDWVASYWWHNPWPDANGVYPDYNSYLDGQNRISGNTSQVLELRGIPLGSGFGFWQTIDARYAIPGTIFKFSIWLYSTDNVKVQVVTRKPYNNMYPSGSAHTIEVPNYWTEVVIKGGFSFDEGPLETQVGIMFESTGTLWMDAASYTDITWETRSLPPAIASQVPPSLFGVHVQSLGVHHTWPGLNHGLLRLWDDGTVWAQIAVDRDPSTWDWQRFDFYMDYVRNNNPGCKVLYTLGVTPYWASRDWGTYLYGGSSTAPADFNDWRTYVNQVASRYGDRIQYYEIWNEVEGGNIFYSGSIEDMKTLSAIAWQEVKTINPSAQILSPNIASGGISWMADYLNAGGGQWIDILSFHSYNYANIEKANLPYIIAVNDLRDRYLPGKPVWNTEGNALGYQFTFAPGQLNYGDALLSVSRSFLVQWAFGIQNWNYYSWEQRWDNEAWLSAEDNTALAGGGLAYFMIQRWIVSAQFVGKWVDDHEWVIQIAYPDKPDYRGYIFWIVDEMNPPPTFTPFINCRERVVMWTMDDNHYVFESNQPVPFGTTPQKIEVQSCTPH